MVLSVDITLHVDNFITYRRHQQRERDGLRRTRHFDYRDVWIDFLRINKCSRFEDAPDEWL